MPGRARQQLLDAPGGRRAAGPGRRGRGRPAASTRRRRGAAAGRRRRAASSSVYSPFHQAMLASADARVVVGGRLRPARRQVHAGRRRSGPPTTGRGRSSSRASTSRGDSLQVLSRGRPAPRRDGRWWRRRAPTASDVGGCAPGRWPRTGTAPRPPPRPSWSTRSSDTQSSRCVFRHPGGRASAARPRARPSAADRLGAPSC